MRDIEAERRVKQESRCLCQRTQHNSAAALLGVGYLRCTERSFVERGTAYKEGGVREIVTSVTHLQQPHVHARQHALAVTRYRGGQQSRL